MKILDREIWLQLSRQVKEKEINGIYDRSSKACSFTVFDNTAMIVSSKVFNRLSPVLFTIENELRI